MSGKVGAFDRIDRPTTPIQQLRLPFDLIETSTDGTHKLAVTFEVGKIGNSVPTLDSIPLDQIPKKAITTGGKLKAWIQVNISAPNDNYHPKIDDSEITIEQATATPDRVEFKVEWEDPASKISGAFFILIADFTVAPAGAENFTIISIDQWLRQSYRGMVLVGGAIDDYVIVV